MRRRACALGVGLALACLGAGGCVSGRNERLAIGAVATPSFGGASGPGAAGPGATRRSRWRTMVVVAPIDGVVHWAPLRGEGLPDRRSDAFDAGVYPSVESVTRAREPVRAGWDDLGRAVCDPVMLPVRVWRSLRGGWWSWSPIAVWKRAPERLRLGGSVGGVREVERGPE